MITKIKLSVIVTLTVLISACSNNEKTESKEAKPVSENKYTTSLRETAERVSKQIQEKDTSFLSCIDSSFAITARGYTEIIGPDLDRFKKEAKAMFSDTATNITTIYTVEKTEAGSVEPVWAGFDQGTFSQTEVSKDGKYNRKIVGPYYRAWKLVDGQWKCYLVVHMAYTCEGNGCK